MVRMRDEHEEALAAAPRMTDAELATSMAGVICDVMKARYAQLQHRPVILGPSSQSSPAVVTMVDSGYAWRVTVTLEQRPGVA